MTVGYSPRLHAGVSHYTFLQDDSLNQFVGCIARSGKLLFASQHIASLLVACMVCLFIQMFSAILFLGGSLHVLSLAIQLLAVSVWSSHLCASDTCMVF